MLTKVDRSADYGPQALIKLIKECIEDPPAQSVVLTIDPEAAELILSAFNKKNRRFKRQKIAVMATEIDMDGWILTGDTVKFSDQGLLIDGQNRLQACINAEKPIQTHVVFGIDQKAFDRIDSGARRSNSDMLALSGVKYSTHVSHAIGWMARLQIKATQRGKSLTNAPTAHQTLWLYKNRYKDLPDHMDWGIRLAAVSGCSPGRGLVLHYLFEYAGGRERADRFMNALIDGFAMDEVPQAAVLRKHLSTLAATLQSSVPANAYYASSIKAWNAWLVGKTVHRRTLLWSKDEPFPIITMAADVENTKS